ncbi:sensor histidine kinase [Ekhidna sp.]|uniref:sensor histidine kinase n=1 Tax=Ekhidna sp. TaxID=2608089 RepID=UPI003BAC4B6B
MITRIVTVIFLLLANLSSQAFEDTVAFKGESLRLDGEWRLVMGAFLTHNDINNLSNSVSIDVPSTWNETSWNGEKIGPYGYGTYFKTFIYSEDLEATSLSIEVPEVSLAYRLSVNDMVLGQVGTPGIDKESSSPKVDYQIFEFNVIPGDTVTLVFHISNYQNRSGGLWYAPIVDYSSKMNRDFELNKSIKLIILGCILIGALFQLSIFLLRRTERFCIYFFLVCASLTMMLLTRGDMPIMDLFPNTSWVTVKKVLYLSIALIGPANALFLREIFRKYYHKRIVDAMAVIAIIASLFILIVPPRISYPFIPFLHAYNMLIGTYLFISLIRAALGGKFGAKFLIIGYLAAFISIFLDVLSSQYIIPDYSLSITHFGIAFYLIQLMLLLSSRYLFAMKGKEELSNHLKKVNKELEEMVERRTKALRENAVIIETKNAELEKAMKEKDHLMAVVAHDLKAPLSSILGISQLMESDLKGQSAEFNEMIKKVTIDGRSMIENLTELKVYEQDNYEVNATLFSLSDFFEQKKIAFEQIAEKKGITFNSILNAEKKKVCSDGNVLGRILDNLLSNALKFTPKGGEVNFTVELSKKKLLITVEDNGPGFTEKDKDKVFQKFQRLSARPTAGESSAGLGLSIVKTLVNLLGGTIELESEHGKGSSFMLSIPV